MQQRARLEEREVRTLTMGVGCQHLDKLVRDSEKDGVVDDAEARMIER